MPQKPLYHKGFSPLSPRARLPWSARADRARNPWSDFFSGAIARAPSQPEARHALGAH
jgi:hypothetical protein